MFDTRFPQLLCSPMIRQLEADGRLVLLELSGPDLDVEVVALVGNFEDFRPGKAVDAQSEKSDKKLFSFYGSCDKKTANRQALSRTHLSR